MAAPTPSAATGSGSKANPYVKTVTASNPPKVKKEKPAARTSTPAELAAKEALRAEVMALGGDDAELKMLLDVDSDSEVEGEEEVVVGKKDKAKKGKAEGGVDVRSLPFVELRERGS
jgi:ribosome biogenesis protein MAK21